MKDPMLKDCTILENNGRVLHYQDATDDRNACDVTLCCTFHPYYVRVVVVSANKRARKRGDFVFDTQVREVLEAYADKMKKIFAKFIPEGAIDAEMERLAARLELELAGL